MGRFDALSDLDFEELVADLLRASYATTEKYAKWAPNATAELAFAERAFAGQAPDRMPAAG